jgi:potassium efflux system protein
LYHIVVPLCLDLLRRSRQRLTVAPGEEPELAAPVLEKQIRGFLRTLFLLAGVLLIAMYWGINQHAIQALDTVHIWRASEDPVVWISAADVLKSILIVTLTFWVLRHLPEIYEVTLFPRIKASSGARYAILTMTRYTLFTVGLLFALSSIGLNLTQIGWIMAPIALGLGFGMQEILSNFVSGLILLIERPVRVGDIAKVGEVLGTVTRINIRATTIMSFDRLENIIPNKDLITKAVTNWTLADKTTRMVIPIGVAYGSDIDEVRSLLQELTVAQPETLKDPAPATFFIGHGDNSLNFETRFFVADPGQRMPVQDRMNTLLNQALAARGIEIPFPQRDVHIKIEEWPAHLAPSAAARPTDAS